MLFKVVAFLFFGYCLVAVGIYTVQGVMFDDQVHVPLLRAQNAVDSQEMLYQLSLVQTGLERWGATNALVPDFWGPGFKATDLESLYVMTNYVRNNLEALPKGVTPDEQMVTFRSWLKDTPSLASLRSFAFFRNSWLLVGFVILGGIFLIVMHSFRSNKTAGGLASTS